MLSLDLTGSGATARIETTATMCGTDLLAAMRIAAADAFAPPALVCSSTARRKIPP